MLTILTKEVVMTAIIALRLQMRVLLKQTMSQKLVLAQTYVLGLFSNKIEKILTRTRLFFL